MFDMFLLRTVGSYYLFIYYYAIWQHTRIYKTIQNTQELS